MKIKLSHLRRLIREAIEMSNILTAEEALAAAERFANPVGGYSGDYGVTFQTVVDGMQLIVGAYLESEEDPSASPHVEYRLFAPAMWGGSPYASKSRGVSPKRWSEISVDELSSNQMSQLEKKAEQKLQEFDPLRHE